MKRLITALATTILMTAGAHAEVTAVSTNATGDGAWAVKDGELYICGMSSELRKPVCMRVNRWDDHFPSEE